MSSVWAHRRVEQRETGTTYRLSRASERLWRDIYCPTTPLLGLGYFVTICAVQMAVSVSVQVGDLDILLGTSFRSAVPNTISRGNYSTRRSLPLPFFVTYTTSYSKESCISESFDYIALLRVVKLTIIYCNGGKKCELRVIVN